MTSHTKFLNEIEGIFDPAHVDKWVRANLNLKTGVSITVQLNHDFTVRILEIGKKLSQADRAKLLAKFPELEGKEIDG
jgi:ribosomal 50S subunit-recycling heat shock protein